MKVARLIRVLIGTLAFGCSRANSPSAESPDEDASHRTSRHEGMRAEAHGQSDAGSTRMPTTEKTALEKLQDAIPELPAGAAVERIVILDVAYPKSKEEFDALGGWTLVLLTAVSHHKEELPLKRAIVTLEGRGVELQAATARRSEVDPSYPDVVRVFGKYRFDGLYYIPVVFTQLPFEVLVDFAAARTDFAVQKFPFPGSADSMPPGVNLDGEPGTPSQAAVQALAKREFPFLADSR